MPRTDGFAYLVLVGHPFPPAKFQCVPPCWQANVVGCVAVLNGIHPCDLRAWKKASLRGRCKSPRVAGGELHLLKKIAHTLAHWPWFR